MKEQQINTQDMVQKLSYFIYENKIAIVDTGSEQSYGYITDIVILGERNQLVQFPRGIAQHMPANVVALLGMDIIGKYDIVIDNGTKQVVFYKEYKAELSNEINLNKFRGIIPTFPAMINGQSVNCIFDTGAQTPYIDPTFLSGVNPVSTIDDFHPSLGIFTTKLWKVMVSINGIENAIEIGVLPDDFGRQVFGQGKADAIIGSIHIPCRRILFSSRRKRLYFD